MKRSNRQVPLILNEDVAGVGFAGELVRVRAGYARNFLLPQNAAVVATPQLEKDREQEIAKATARREQEVADRKELAKTLAAEPVVVTLKTGPGGRVFGSVTATEFAKQVKEQRKAVIDAKQLHGLPLHGLGSHTVSAKLGLGVVALIPVRVNGEAAAPPAAATAAKTEATPTK